MCHPRNSGGKLVCFACLKKKRRRMGLLMRERRSTKPNNTQQLNAFSAHTLEFHAHQGLASVISFSLVTGVGKEHTTKKKKFNKVTGGQNEEISRR